MAVAYHRFSDLLDCQGQKAGFSATRWARIKTVGLDREILSGGD